MSSSLPTCFPVKHPLGSPTAVFRRSARRRQLNEGYRAPPPGSDMAWSPFRLVPHRIYVQETLPLLTRSLTRPISTTSTRNDAPSWPPPPVPQLPVGPSSSPPSPSSYGPDSDHRPSFLRDWASSASFQAALTTVIGLGMVFGAGVGYLEWYKSHVLHRVSNASFYHRPLPMLRRIQMLTSILARLSGPLNQDMCVHGSPPQCPY